MDRPAIIAAGAVALALLVIVALAAFAPIGGDRTDAPETTTAPTPSTTAEPVPGTTTERTATDTMTTTTGPTTTEPQPDYDAELRRLGDGVVYDGEAAFGINVTNAGPAGTYAYNLTLERREDGDFDRVKTGEIEVGPNEALSSEIDVGFRATGTYDVYLDGSHEMVVEVNGLSTGGTGGTGATTTVEPTTTDDESEANSSGSGSSTAK